MNNNKRKVNDLDRLFWKKVFKISETDCWVWTGSTDSSGYGSAWFENKRWSAYRLSFFIHNGYQATVCRHKCDNPQCVNPLHLEDGTQADNVRDCVERGRHRSGNSTKTHCPAGHDYRLPETTHIDSKGLRHCRICDRLRKAKKKELVRPAMEAFYSEGVQ